MHVGPSRATLLHQLHTLLANNRLTELRFHLYLRALLVTCIVHVCMYLCMYVCVYVCEYMQFSYMYTCTEVHGLSVHVPLCLFLHVVEVLSARTGVDLPLARPTCHVGLHVGTAPYRYF